MIRDAKLSDAPSILEIYRPFVTSTIVSFEYLPPTLEEMEGRIKTIQESHPYLVYEEAGKILGYAYATQHKEREGYKWVAEASIYLAPEGRGKGIGSLLYGKLFRILESLGFYKVIAGIAGVNEESDRFHRKHGFKPVAVWEGIGNKFGEWIDTTWYVKVLREGKKEGKEFPKDPVLYKDWKES